jgi:peptidoglycan/xylan/chitin deacetylase (PgdA/CDA1 family)
VKKVKRIFSRPNKPVRALCHALAILGLALVATAAPAQKVAFTWDDLPVHGPLPPATSRVAIAEAILGAMRAEHMPPAFGMVNGIRTVQEPASAAALQAWADAGMPLGNHTWSHINLNTSTAADFEADLLKNEATLRQFAPQAGRKWLRYPFLAEGNSPAKRIEVRQFLAAHGYKIAGVTMSFGDYAFNEPYVRCLTKGETAAIGQLEQAYLKAAANDIVYTRAMAHALFGHDIPYVLLMHVGAFDARMLPRLLSLFRTSGFTFITLEQAERDPFYRNDVDLSLPGNVDTLEAAMQARHLPLPEKPPVLVSLEEVCR